MIPTTGRDVRKRQVDSFAVPRRPGQFRPVLRGWASGGGKSEGKPPPYQRRVALRPRSWGRIIDLRQTYTSAKPEVFSAKQISVHRHPRKGPLRWCQSVRKTLHPSAWPSLPARIPR
jgi:hypothetical protein